MKKKIATAAAVLLLLLLALTGFAAYNANSLIAKYKPDLEGLASKALGSKVTLGKLEASVFPRAKVTVDEMRITRGSAEGLSLKNVTLAVKLLPLLTGNLEIVRFSLEKPHVTVVKDESGMYLAGFPKPGLAGASGSAQAKGGQAQGSGTKDGAAKASALGVNLESFELTEGLLTFSDKTKNKDISLSDLNVHAALMLAANSVSIAPLEVDAKILSKNALTVKAADLKFAMDSGDFNAKNLGLTLAGNPLILDAAFNTKQGKGSASVNSSGIALESLVPMLQDFAPQVSAFKIQGRVSPALKVEFGPGSSYNAKGDIGVENVALNIGPLVITGTAGKIGIDAAPDSQKVAAENLSLRLGGAELKVTTAAEIKGKTFFLPKFQAAGFGGSIIAGITSALDGDKNFSGSANASALAVSPAIRALKPDAPDILSGTLHKFDVKFEGAAGADIAKSITGNASLDFREGTLKGVNIAGLVLQKVDILGGVLAASVPPEFQSLVNSPDTEIKSCTGSFTISSGKIRTTDLNVVGPYFTLQADGSAGFDTNLDLNATISFDQKFSAALAARIKEVSAILDSDKRLTIPLTLKGIAPKLTVVPNTEKLLKMGAKKLLQDKAGDLLQGVLGGGKGKGGSLFGF